MRVGWLGDSCGAGAITGELAVGELRSVHDGPLFWCHRRTGPSDPRVPAVSDSDLEASSFISDLYVNFEKS